MFKDKLLQMGFSENEATLYLELLKIGPQPVSVLAKRMGFNRCSTYSMLKSLQTKGVVSSCKNNNIHIFAANDPNCLVGYLDMKCKTFDYYKTELLTMIPKFRSLCSGYDFKKPVVSYYEGLEGVKNVMYDALNADGEFRSYLSLNKWFAFGMKDFLIEYKNVRIMNRKIQLKALVPDTPEVRVFFNENYYRDGLTEFLFVPDGEKNGMFENEMNIYGNKVAIMHLGPGDEYGVVIESREIAEMQRSIFDTVWARLKNINDNNAT